MDIAAKKIVQIDKIEKKIDLVAMLRKNVLS